MYICIIPNIKNSLTHAGKLKQTTLKSASVLRAAGGAERAQEKKRQTPGQHYICVALRLEIITFLRGIKGEQWECVRQG